jgi:hypothetical protein
MWVKINISPIEVQKKGLCGGEQMVVFKALISAVFLIQQIRKAPTAKAAF